MSNIKDANWQRKKSKESADGLAWLDAALLKLQAQTVLLIDETPEVQQYFEEQKRNKYQYNLNTLRENDLWIAKVYIQHYMSKTKHLVQNDTIIKKIIT